MKLMTRFDTQCQCDIWTFPRLSILIILPDCDKRITRTKNGRKRRILNLLRNSAFIYIKCLSAPNRSSQHLIGAAEKPRRQKTLIKRQDILGHIKVMVLHVFFTTKHINYVIIKLRSGSIFTFYILFLLTVVSLLTVHYNLIL